MDAATRWARHCPWGCAARNPEALGGLVKLVTLIRWPERRACVGREADCKNPVPAWAHSAKRPQALLGPNSTFDRAVGLLRIAPTSPGLPVPLEQLERAPLPPAQATLALSVPSHARRCKKGLTGSPRLAPTLQPLRPS